MAWAKVYTDEQRAAVIREWCDAHTRPAGKIARMALAGELVCDGQRLAAFEIPESMVREIGNRELRRRRGLAQSKLADQDPRDAVETLRRRLCGILDHEIDRIEKEQARKDSKPVDGQRIAKLGRAARELAALPGPHDPRPAAPPPSKAAASDQSLAGQLRRSMRGEGASGDPVHPPTTTPPGEREHTGDEPTHDDTTTHTHTPAAENATHTTTTRQTDETTDSPRSSARAEFGSLSAERVTVRSGP